MSPYRSIFDKLIWHTIEALHSSLFGPDGAVNIVTNSINQLHSQWHTIEALHSSLFGPDGAVNIVTNSINQLHSQWHTIVESNWPMFQNVSNTNSNYLSSIVSIVQ